MDLPVDVGFGDMIEVDQGQATYPAAGQRFCGPRPHAADADHDDVRIEYALRAVQAIEPAQPAKAAFEKFAGGRVVHSRSSSHI